MSQAKTHLSGKNELKKILIQRSRYNGHIHTDIQRRATLAG